tara:strand:- start:532 stop:969 length:438 start_codon:yes stop_codon:yes gene_type:complete
MNFRLPNKSTLFTNINRDNDERGQILSIVDFPVKNVSIIESKAKTFRSNHYHHIDFHFMYLLEGEIDYFFKSLGSNQINYLKIKEKETIFTPANEIHCCYFPVFTSMVVSSGFPRDKETYEKDTERVDFINNSNIDEMLKKYGSK